MRSATVLLSIHLSITWTPCSVRAATCRTSDFGGRDGLKGPFG